MLLHEDCKPVFAACREEPVLLSRIQEECEKIHAKCRHDDKHEPDVLPATKKASELAWVEPDTDNYPLHAALENHLRSPPYEVVEYLMKLHPQAVELSNGKGLIPLHMACAAGPKADPAVIQLLYEAWKDGLRIATAQHGNMPIHIACLTKAPLPVIQSLVESRPRSVWVQNHQGETPYDMAKKPYTPSPYNRRTNNSSSPSDPQQSKPAIHCVPSVLSYLKENGGGPGTDGPPVSPRRRNAPANPTPSPSSVMLPLQDKPETGEEGGEKDKNGDKDANGNDNENDDRADKNAAAGDSDANNNNNTSPSKTSSNSNEENENENTSAAMVSPPPSPTKTRANVKSSSSVSPSKSPSKASFASRAPKSPSKAPSKSPSKSPSKMARKKAPGFEVKEVVVDLDQDFDDEITVDPALMDDDDASHKSGKTNKNNKKNKSTQPSIAEIDEGDEEDEKEKEPEKEVVVEDKEAKREKRRKMMRKWNSDYQTRSMDDIVVDAEKNDKEEEWWTERDVVLDDNVLDHIVLAAPSLLQGMEEFRDMTGFRPLIAGNIKDVGLWCARISFCNATYIEIIAPHPTKPGPIGDFLKSKNLTKLTLFHYAIRSTKFQSLKHQIPNRCWKGYKPDHIIMMGARPDGSPKSWDNVYFYGDDEWGGTMPYLIRWRPEDHPCRRLPMVGDLEYFKITAAAENPIHKVFQHMEIPKDDIQLVTGNSDEKPVVSFAFSSPKGTIEFTTDAGLGGFQFPGYEEEEEKKAEPSQALVEDDLD